MLSGAYSFERAFVSASPAARLTDVGTEAAPGCFAPMFSRLMMLPPPAARRCGTASRIGADRPEELQVEIGLPVLVGDVAEWPGGRGAGVVDQDVEAAEALDCRTDHALDVGRLPHVGRDRHDRRACPESSLATCSSRRPGGRRSPPARPRGRAIRRRAPDALAAAGHDRDLAREPEIHPSPRLQTFQPSVGVHTTTPV